MANLFIQERFQMHSGGFSDFKLECDALSKEDYDTLAFLIAKQYKFNKVEGIPSGGLPFAQALKKYEDSSSSKLLIVDDVLTTGGSMEKVRANHLLVNNYKESDIQGIVVFARGEFNSWITPFFSLNSLFWQNEK